MAQRDRRSTARKDPRHRPFSATALQLAFKEAQRRHVEGVGVLQHATAGFSPLQLTADRAEAEKVLGIKPKKERSERDSVPLLERPIVLLVAFVLAVTTVVWFLLPLGEDTLRSRAEVELASDDWLRWNDARDGYLYDMIERFPRWQARRVGSRADRLGRYARGRASHCSQS